MHSIWYIIKHIFQILSPTHLTQETQWWHLKGVENQIWWENEDLLVVSSHWTRSLDKIGIGGHRRVCFLIKISRRGCFNSNQNESVIDKLGLIVYIQIRRLIILFCLKIKIYAARIFFADKLDAWEVPTIFLQKISFFSIRNY